MKLKIPEIEKQYAPLDIREKLVRVGGGCIIVHVDGVAWITDGIAMIRLGSPDEHVEKRFGDFYSSEEAVRKGIRVLAARPIPHWLTTRNLYHWLDYRPLRLYSGIDFDVLVRECYAALLPDCTPHGTASDEGVVYTQGAMVMAVVMPINMRALCSADLATIADETAYLADFAHYPEPDKENDDEPIGVVMAGAVSQ